MCADEEAGRNCQVKRRCCTAACQLLPHFCLILSLVGYAVLGALLFRHIEGGQTSPDPLYDLFVTRLWNISRNHSSDDEDAWRQAFMEDAKIRISKDFDVQWLQKPEQWNFFGSLFFCCTVFTTVGYGHIYPITGAGKVACMVYAMIGIPLMLFVIADVGDVLAVIFSRSYNRLRKLYSKNKPLLPKLCPSQRKPRENMPLHAYSFTRDMVAIKEPMSITQVLSTQSTIKRKSLQLKNAEIFDKIIARENIPVGKLMRSTSCPELDRLHKPSPFSMWDFTGIGEELDKLDVPVTLIVVVILTYIFLEASILRLWEDQWTFFSAFYFCFITLTTIGFGDIVPNHPKYFMVTSFFIIVGMAIMSMAFKLGQSRIISCYRKLIQLISGGKVKNPE
ncbi:potassium channel subfamily K member 18 [Erpetoichthys calabaricus]|uniref:potassium channel subfamily K member 18 n=1 Tax=Erpetoichthys calabaricus TaxID=27687 RepID=UPI00223463B5|nr:potassium channel subfamily K member 18 [Erpetoichthys calabaricus]